MGAELANLLFADVTRMKPQIYVTLIAMLATLEMDQVKNKECQPSQLGIV